MFLLSLCFPPAFRPPRNDDGYESAPRVLPRAGSARLRRLAVEEEEGDQRLPHAEVAALLVHPEGAGALLVLQPTGGNKWECLKQHCVAFRIILTLQWAC